MLWVQVDETVCERLRISHALNIKYIVYFSAVAGVLPFCGAILCAHISHFPSVNKQKQNNAKWLHDYNTTLVLKPLKRNK